MNEKQMITTPLYSQEDVVYTIDTLMEKTDGISQAEIDAIYLFASELMGVSVDQIAAWSK